MLSVDLIAITQPISQGWNQETLIEYCGRVCTNTTEKTGNDSGKFIKARIKQKHYSILEFGDAVFEISGVSRSCLAQLTRHRMASYAVLSQRFVDQRSILDCVMPDSIKENEIAKSIYEKAMCGTDIAYTMLRNIGIPKQDARFALPIATTTHLIMKANFRAWREIIEKRCDKAAQHEIRELCTKILKILYQQSPSVFEDLKEKYIG